MDQAVHQKNSFDLLRLIAATAVLFSHSYPLTAQTASEPISVFTHYGTFGSLAVAIFFIISGYLVAGSYLRSAGALDFIVKRAVRLLPALWCVVMLTVFIIGPLLSTLSLKEYFLNPQTYLYLSNLFLHIRHHLPGVFESNPYPGSVNGSLWTLPVEATMYFIIFSLGISRLLTKTGCLLTLIAFILIYITFPEITYPKLNLFGSLGILYFAGVLCVFMGKFRGNKYIALTSLLLLIILAKTSFAPILLLILLPYLIIYIGHMKSRLSDWISKTGDFSYGIYVYAFLVEQTVILFLGKDISPLSVSLISLPITVILAYGSWHLIEKPVLDNKKKILAVIKNNITKNIKKSRLNTVGKRFFGRGERI